MDLLLLLHLQDPQALQRGTDWHAVTGRGGAYAELQASRDWGPGTLRPHLPGQPPTRCWLRAPHRVPGPVDWTPRTAGGCGSFTGRFSRLIPEILVQVLFRIVTRENSPGTLASLGPGGAGSLRQDAWITSLLRTRRKEVIHKGRRCSTATLVSSRNSDYRNVVCSYSTEGKTFSVKLDSQKLPTFLSQDRTGRRLIQPLGSPHQ